MNLLQGLSTVLLTFSLGTLAYITMVLGLGRTNPPRTGVLVLQRVRSRN